jgi:hypothetical protein
MKDRMTQAKDDMVLTAMVVWSEYLDQCKKEGKEPTTRGRNKAIRKALYEGRNVRFELEAKFVLQHAPELVDLILAGKMEPEKALAEAQQRIEKAH